MANEVNQNTTAKVIWTAVDEDGVAIAAFDSLKMTLYDVSTGRIINSRDAVDVSGSFAAGILTLILTPLDNAILIAKPAESEEHVLLLEYTYASTKKGSHEIPITVKYILKSHLA